MVLLYPKMQSKYFISETTNHLNIYIQKWKNISKQTVKKTNIFWKYLLSKRRVGGDLMNHMAVARYGSSKQS